jgi:hypothetical protein
MQFFRRFYGAPLVLAAALMLLAGDKWMIGYNVPS